MHPSEAELIRYLEGTLSKKRREYLERHMANCALCTEQLAAIVRLPKVLADRSAPEVDGEMIKKSSVLLISPRPYGRYAIAATIVLAVGLGTLILLRQEPAPMQFRGITPAPSLTLLPKDGSALSPATSLRWSSLAPALAYELTVMNEDGTTIWTAATKDTFRIIPASVALEAGKRYLWRVDALFPDDTKLRSKLFTFIFSP